LELNLSRDVKGNKKGFCKQISSKWKTRESVGLSPNQQGSLMTKDTEEHELVPSAPHSSLARGALRNPKPLRPEGMSGARKTYPWWRRITSGNI